MRYDEFLRRYTAAYREWQLGSGDAGEALSGLGRMVPDIDGTRSQETARFLIGRWQAEASPAAQERMERALRIAADAAQDEGSTDDGGTEVRIGRLEAGMRSIAAVARETDDEFEQYALLALNEPLARLAGRRD